MAIARTHVPVANGHTTVHHTSPLWRNCVSNHKEVLEWIRWNHTQPKQIHVSEIFNTVYPISSNIWQIDSGNFYSPLKNQRIIFDWLSKKLNMNTVEAWYDITSSQLIEVGLTTLLHQSYNGSPVHMIMSIYPEYGWLIWKFKKLPEYFWNEIHNQRQFLDWVALQLNISDVDDWYSISGEQLISIGGTTLFCNVYNSSPSQMLLSVFPENNWFLWRFSRAPRQFWKNSTYDRVIVDWNRLEYQRQYLDWIAHNKLNIEEWGDWYNVTQDYLGNVIATLTPPKFLSNVPLSQLLMSIYPEYNWIVPNFFAKSIQSNMTKQQIELFLNLIQEKLKISQTDMSWLTWQLTNAPSEFWANLIYQRLFLDWAGDHVLKVKELKDWYHVTKKKLSDAGIPRELLNIYSNSLVNMLQSVYAEFQFEHPISGHTSRSFGEDILLQSLKFLLPENTILHQNYKHPALVHAFSEFNMELDIYCPKYSLAFEFQGKHHYQIGYHGHPDRQKDRDIEKYEACKQNNITLIEIPYWWNGNKLSLAATIGELRPDIPLKTQQTDQSLEAVDSTIASISKIPPEVQQAREMVEEDPASFFIKVAEFEEFMDPSGKILTEKYDGFRAIWTGSEFILKKSTSDSSLLFRNTKLIPPLWYQQQLPSIYVDGELWGGYRTHNKLQQLLRQATITPSQWREIQYIIFDSPDHSIREKAYIKRLQLITECLSNNNVGHIDNSNTALNNQTSTRTQQNSVRVVEFKECEGVNDMNNFLEKALEHGGEGVVLHDAKAAYIPGFSISWKKEKFYCSTARVLKIESPSQVICRSLHGVEFVLRSPSSGKYFEKIFQMISQNMQPAIKFRYYGLSPQKAPVFPIFEQLLDYQWHQLLPFNIQVQRQHNKSCLVCSTKIPKQQLCVEVHSIYRYNSGGFKIIPVNFCLNETCLEGINKHRRAKARQHNYLDFRNELGIQREENENGNTTPITLSKSQMKQLEAFLKSTKINFKQF